MNKPLELQETKTAPVKPAKRRAYLPWLPFTEQLASVIARMQEDQYLILSVKRTNLFVQFAAQGSSGIRIEATSNAYLARSDQLEGSQTEALVAAGWSPPTGTPESSTPEADPHGSSNFFIDVEHPVPFDEVARLAVRTFTDILRVPYPRFLAYEAFDADGDPIEFPELGLKAAVRPASDETTADPRHQLMQAMREIAGFDDLEFDRDGDIAIRSGSAVVFVRLHAGSPYLNIFSLLLTGVEETPELLNRLNEINAGASNMRLFTQGNVIVAVSELPATPLVREHLEAGLHEFCQITDGIDGLLQSEFGGETWFPETMPSTLKH